MPQTYLFKGVAPPSVTSVGDYAFSDCISLQSAKISGSVTSIGDYAFLGCNILSSITCNAKTPPAAALAFSSVNVSNCTLHVPIGTKALYQAADGWKYFMIVDDVVTEVEKIDDANLQISPNPVRDKLFITSTYSIEKVEIYDFSGKLIMVNSQLSNENAINISSLPKGIYLVKVYAHQGIIAKKFVKE